ncbi:sensor histidine kinase [Glaciecola sp. 1036]|uniref:sensor histidine kinase n=1 Tax=Alteromonadaceae TaxID=72275 RepID=UPI003D0421E6
MRLSLYAIIQVSAWGLVYAFTSTIIAQRPVNPPFEFLYGAILITCSALGSHGIRYLYRKLVKNWVMWQQILYFILASIFFAAMAVSVMISIVFILSTTDYAFPIPASQRWFVIKSVFTGNFLNMLALLFLWCALYVSISYWRQLKQTQKLLQDTQLDALTNQLKPHFLFNSLNNIRALILEDPERSRTMLAVLSDMLRYALNQEQSVKVTVEKEMGFVRDYLALCSIQFEDRLHTEELIDENCTRCLVPRMLLQLCVENCIKHGLSHSVSGGTIGIQINSESSKLIVIVTNPGILKQDKLKSGIGIANIRRRLALLYDGDASIDLSQQDDAVVTKICLPLELG